MLNNFAGYYAIFAVVTDISIIILHAFFFFFSKPSKCVKGSFYEREVGKVKDYG